MNSPSPECSARNRLAISTSIYGAHGVVWTESAYRWASTWFAALAFAVTTVGAEPTPAGMESAPAVAGAPSAGGQEPSPEPDSSPLRPPAEPAPVEPPTPPALPEPLLQTERDPPLGFAGPSGVLSQELQQDSHFVPMEDRWRLGFPTWDRYGRGHPLLEDYPYAEGAWWDLYRQHVLKGDYPLIGQDIFLNLSGSSLAIFDGRQLPTDTPHLQALTNPSPDKLFARSDQFLYRHFFRLSTDLSHGDAAFKPVDWRIRITPVFNINYLAVNQQTVADPDRRMEISRGRTFLALEEWFVECKLADLSVDYDFLSVRLGSQFFTSDFRGFIFTDTNRAARLFGTRCSNRDQFNLIYFRQAEKDTNSDLNSYNDRGQDVVIANYYRQDFIWPGYTAELSVHYNHDPANFHVDTNGAIVRPDPVGALRPHELNVAYLGWAGSGHIEWLNIMHAGYWALGRDSLNPLGNRAQDINAQLGVLELSYDYDWARFRISSMWASGQHDQHSGQATGFDSIFESPIFAGGIFSYWQRQPIKLDGVNLKNKESLLPDVRSSKTQGQSNFNNPGLLLVNFGLDLDLTPKLRMTNNANLLWFDETEVLRTFLRQSAIHHFIGTDLSTGFEYRPWLNNNAIARFGVAGLLPGRGFEDIYHRNHGEINPLVAGFVELTLAF
jgi:hypothetical protein